MEARFQQKIQIPSMHSPCNRLFQSISRREKERQKCSMGATRKEVFIKNAGAAPACGQQIVSANGRGFE